MRARLPFLLALVPVLALVAALPLVNRLQPIVLGLPFLLFWIVAWVLATPLFLGAAYLLGSPRREREPGIATPAKDDR